MHSYATVCFLTTPLFVCTTFVVGIYNSVLRTVLLFVVCKYTTAIVRVCKLEHVRNTARSQQTHGPPLLIEYRSVTKFKITFTWVNYLPLIINILLTLDQQRDVKSSTS